MALIWGFGRFTMLGYMSLSYLRLRWKLATAIYWKENIWRSEHVETPFILGLFSPRIYPPYQIPENDLVYILAHERAHLSRRDHWIKPIGFLILSIYWFHPLIWLGYVLLCRDIEMACDEKVIREMGMAACKPYSAALFHASVGHNSIAACPLAFGELGTKERIKKVLNYKKPGFWVVLLALGACIFVAMSFLTELKNEDRATQSAKVESGEMKADAPAVDLGLSIEPKIDEGLNQAIRRAILEKNKNDVGEIQTTSFHVLATDRQVEGQSGDEILHVYLDMLYLEYNNDDGKLIEATGKGGNEAIALRVTKDDKYEMIDYWVPLDGELYQTSIQEKFPRQIWHLLFNLRGGTPYDLQRDCLAQAIEYWQVDTRPVVSSLFEDIMQAPVASSDLEDYVKDKGYEIVVLENYGKYALDYFFDSFASEERTDREECIMAAISTEIVQRMGEQIPDNWALNGEYWYESFQKRAENINDMFTDEEIAEFYPATHLLLEKSSDI